MYETGTHPAVNQTFAKLLGVNSTENKLSGGEQSSGEQPGLFFMFLY